MYNPLSNKNAYRYAACSILSNKSIIREMYKIKCSIHVLIKKIHYQGKSSIFFFYKYVHVFFKTFLKLCAVFPQALVLFAA